LVQLDLVSAQPCEAVQTPAQKPLGALRLSVAQAPEAQSLLAVQVAHSPRLPPELEPVVPVEVPVVAVVVPVLLVECVPVEPAVLLECDPAVLDDAEDVLPLAPEPVEPELVPPTVCTPVVCSPVVPDPEVAPVPVLAPVVPVPDVLVTWTPEVPVELVRWMPVEPDPCVPVADVVNVPVVPLVPVLAVEVFLMGVDGPHASTPAATSDQSRLLDFVFMCPPRACNDRPDGCQIASFSPGRKPPPPGSAAQGAFRYTRGHAAISPSDRAGDA
jgi:hypothetical protein